MTNGPDGGSTGRLTNLATARSGLVTLAVFVALSFASVPLLHAGQRAVGFRATPLQLRAWILSSERISRDGIRKGQPIGFEVSLPSGPAVHWTLKTDGVTIARGVVSGAPGTIAQRTLQTSLARPGEWLTIWIGDLETPLKVWVAR